MKKNLWTKEKYQNLWKQIQEQKEEKYRIFSEKLIFTKYPILGVRIPFLRKMSSFIAKQDIDSYLKIAQSNYHEEILMKGFVIGKIKDKDKLKQAFLDFLPLIDNWATCDMVISSLKTIKKNQKYFLSLMDSLFEKKETYYLRAGFVLLLNYYVEDSFFSMIEEKIKKVNSDEYYVEMAQAWLLCECFIKNQEVFFPFLKEGNISFSLLSKTIQKICDSNRVDRKTKEKVKKLKKELYS